MSNRRPETRRSIVTALILSLISGFFLLGGLVAVLTVLPFPTSSMTTFPGTILLFFLTIVFSLVLYRLLPAENTSNDVSREV